MRQWYGLRASFMTTPRCHSVIMNGPVPIGFSANALAFSSSVSPGRRHEFGRRKDAGVERRKHRQQCRIRMLQLKHDGGRIGDIDRGDRSQQRVPGALFRIARAVKRPLHVLCGHRRTVGEFDIRPQRERQGLAVIGPVPFGGKAGLQPKPIRAWVSSSVS